MLLAHEQSTPELVQAALSCQVCLHAPTTIRVSGTPLARIATLECAHCHNRTRVDLTPEDAARLWTLNRRVGYVHFAQDAI